MKAEERRKQPRVPARGAVVIRRGGPTPLEVTGTLEDVSPDGFRASYRGVVLSTSDLIDFEAEDRSGSAVVVWSRILGEERQSGFLIRR